MEILRTNRQRLIEDWFKQPKSNERTIDWYCDSMKLVKKFSGQNLQSIYISIVRVYNKCIIGDFIKYLFNSCPKIILKLYEFFSLLNYTFGSGTIDNLESFKWQIFRRLIIRQRNGTIYVINTCSCIYFVDRRGKHLFVTVF